MVQIPSHRFSDSIDPYIQLVSVLCSPVSSIPTSLSFFKSFCPCNNISNDSIDKIVLESGRLPGIIRIVVVSTVFYMNNLHEWSKVLNLLKSHRSKL